MALFAVNVTRDCTFTQTATVEVAADTKEQAHEKALLMTYKDIDEDGAQFHDDDDSYHYGENGTYIADTNSTEELA